MIKMLRISLVTVLGLAFAQGAAAQAKPEILVKQRQAAMTLMGKYFGPMAAMAQGKVAFNASVVQRNAGFLDNLSRMPWDGFDASTRGVKSRALPAVFENGAGFKQAASRLENEAAKLASVSRSGDEAAVKAQIGAVGKSCGGCHDDFRSD
ncbi:MAG: cytochrome c [Burkholderiales bacterium]